MYIKPYLVIVFINIISLIVMIIISKKNKNQDIIVPFSSDGISRFCLIICISIGFIPLLNIVSLSVYAFTFTIYLISMIIDCIFRLYGRLDNKIINWLNEKI